MKKEVRYRGDEFDKTPESVPKNESDYNPNEHLTYTKRSVGKENDRFEMSMQDATSQIQNDALTFTPHKDLQNDNQKD